MEVSMGARTVMAALLLAGWSGLVAAQEPKPAPVTEKPTPAAAAKPVPATATEQAAPAAATEKSTFRVEQVSIDLGTVRAGAEAVGTFLFHNDGKEPVKIIKAKPS
jgi:hypothetical protein